MRLSGRAMLVLVAVVGLVIVAATDQIAPATSERVAQLRIWLVARASGITAYLLLTAQVVLGLLLSHPTNQARWRISKHLFPWHEQLWVFVLAFLGAHVASLVADPYAGVGLGGALIPGLSSYRSSAVGLGSLACYALLATGLTARYTKLLPAGFWLSLHRLSLVVFGLSWLHGVLAGTDGAALSPLYGSTGLAVLVAAAYRYWVLPRAAKRALPTEERARGLDRPAERTPAAERPVPRPVAVAAVVRSEPAPWGDRS
jgi:sulfoxide reductase heme-binding subunit YedZ